MGAFNIHTQSLTEGSISIVASDFVQKVSVLAKLGIVTIQGSQSFQGMPSTALSLVVGQGITIASQTTQNPIDGLTITAETVGDIADILISTQ